MILDGLRAYAAIAVAGALAVALATTSVFLVKEKLAHAETQSTLNKERGEWKDERAKAATDLAQATTRARETEQSLQASADKAKEATNEKIHALTGRAADLARRVRVAESNAATARLVSATTSVGSATEDRPSDNVNRFSDRTTDDLVALAQRAETVRLQLASCEAQYDGARAALMGKP